MPSIQQTLAECFSAPLPEFYQRRIIFWQDEDREFESMLEEQALPDVKIVRLTGTNNFSVKKLLLHDDVTSNFLIYNPFSYTEQQENWLRDIELYSEVFRADLVSLQMQELGVAESPLMRKTMKLYRKFFANKERVAKLARLNHRYESPLALHTDIMAVLAGIAGGSVQDVLIAVLEGGLNEAENVPLTNITKFGSIEAFWQLVQRGTGFVHDEEKGLTELAAHVLLSALAQTMGAQALRGLERSISEGHTAFCYSIVSEWRGRAEHEGLYRLCREVEAQLNLDARFAKMELATLVTSDIFPAIDETILSRFFTEVAQNVIKAEAMQKVIEARRTCGWYTRFAAYYEALRALSEMQMFYQSNAEGFHIVEPAKVWKLYTETAYQMDSHYRHFQAAFAAALTAGVTTLEDKLKQVADYVERLYQNWFLTALTDCWTQAAASELATLGYVSEVARQQDFYVRYVQSLTKKNTRAFVIVSDALRYEVAAELCTRLSRTTHGSVTLESMQAAFPSVTKFGMAALLPGRTLAMDADGDVLRDGMSTHSTSEREKVLQAANAKSVTVTYQALLAMKRAERQALVSGKEVVYIYHNTIDAMGDKLVTEQKVFAACEDAIDEIMNMVRIITSDMQGTAISITADHGFLYTRSPLAEYAKLSQDVINGEVIEIGRRYALTAPNAQVAHMLPVRVDALVDGCPVQGYAPRDTTRLKISGGGANYVHGGTSLQEMVVPVVMFRNLRASSKHYVETTNAELVLLSETRKISNLIFALDFLQKQPMNEKVRPCQYTVYMTDDAGTIVSDPKIVIADRVNKNASERVFHVSFNLKGGAYGKDSIYHLVIANEMDAPQEIDFTIDIVFADDFGFDW